MAKGGGGKITPRPIFQLPLPNRLEASQMLWWLFLDMAGLQNGAKFLHLPPPGIQYGGLKSEVRLEFYR